MSTIFDIKSLTIDDGTVIDVSGTLAGGISADITVPNTISSIDIQVPGMQGPAGNQNVFSGTTDPSKDVDGNTVWGAEEEGNVWLKV